MNHDLVIGLGLTVASAALVNWAYLQEHDATAAMPRLTLRRPLDSARALLASRAWLKGLAVEIAGFGAYAAALGFAPLALVQAVSAGGVAVLAFISRRRSGRRPSRRERVGVVLAVLGLAGLGVSLAGSTASGSPASLPAVIAWIAGSAALAAIVLVAATPRIGRGLSYATAAGVLMAAGDVATKVATSDAARPWTIVPALALYGIGTSCLQIAYQHGGPVATAGVATLLTNAIPIVAATTILHEGLPGGALGVLRVAAFVAVVAGAVALARAEPAPPAAPADAPARRELPSTG
jgi:hypothetical protein